MDSSAPPGKKLPALQEQGIDLDEVAAVEGKEHVRGTLIEIETGDRETVISVE